MDSSVFGLQPLPGGYSGETFLAHTEEGDQVVRVYGRNPERCMVDAALLRLLDGVLPVAAVRDVRPRTATEPGVLVTSRLPGARLDLLMALLDDGQLTALGHNLGLLLARLSGIPQPRFGFFEGAGLAVVDANGTPTPTSRSDSLREWAEQLSSAGQFREWDERDWLGLLDLTDLADDLLEGSEPRRSVLVHSDFNPKNLLVDPATLDVTGLVDWEYAHAGSPYTDLGNLTRFERRPAFVDAVAHTLVSAAPPLAPDPLRLGRASDLWALIDLVGRDRPNPVTTLAETLLLAQARAGDLMTWPWDTPRVDPVVETHVSW